MLAQKFNHILVALALIHHHIQSCPAIVVFGVHVGFIGQKNSCNVYTVAEVQRHESTLIQIEHTWVQTDGQHDVAVLGCILADEFEEADFTGAR